MINFKMIINFLNTDKRFNYIHDILNDNIEVYIKNSNSKFTVIKDTHGIKVISGIGSLTGIFKVSFNTYDMTSFKKAVETIYRSSTIEDEQPEEDKMAEINHILADHNSITDFGYQSKEVVEYPRGGNTMPNQTVNKSFDFVNDYKLMKSIERSVNDNLKVITDTFYKYTKVDAPATIIADDNNKVFFFVEHENALELNFEFFTKGDLYSYSYTNRGIRLLDEYNKQAVLALANLIERTVKVWLNKFSSKEDFIEVSDRVLSSAENIKVMIGLMARTIDVYNH